MVERLFVYGTLAPGRPNAHVLDTIEGSWEPASVTGRLRQEGWGAALGFPGIDLDEQGGEVAGFLFSAAKLADYWAALDAFEGEAYERVLTAVKRQDGSTVEAFIYALRGQA